MGLCTDIVCFLSSVYLAVLLKLDFLLQLFEGSVCMLCACTQPLTIFQVMSGERREIGGISIGFQLFKNYPRLFFLTFSSTKAYKQKQAVGFWQDQKAMLVIFPFAVDIKASCLNDTSFHRVQCKGDPSALQRCCFNETYETRTVVPFRKAACLVPWCTKEMSNEKLNYKPYIIGTIILKFGM